MRRGGEEEEVDGSGEEKKAKKKITGADQIQTCFGGRLQLPRNYFGLKRLPNLLYGDDQVCVITYELSVLGKGAQDRPCC